jgi:hypothetical protein
MGWSPGRVDDDVDTPRDALSLRQGLDCMFTEMVENAL